MRLPEVQKAITSDFVVLPCDLISEIDGTRLIQQWMSLNPLSSTTNRGVKPRKGGLCVYYPTQGLESISHKKDETDFIGTVPLPSPTVPPPQSSLRLNMETLVLAMPTDTLNDKLEEANGVFHMRSQLSVKYGRIKLKTKYRDAHIYIFPHWVKEYARRNETFDSISEDVVGWWAKAQWQNGLGEKLGLDEMLGSSPDFTEDMESSQIEEETADAASLSTTRVALPVHSAQGSTTFASRVGASASLESLSIPPLLAYIQSTPPTSSTQALIRRVDNSHALLNISLHLAKQQSHQLSHEHKIHPSAILGQQARVSQEDSLIAENVKIGMRSIIKESVIGANCDIGANTKLTKCLLMDGVTIGDGVQLIGCTIGRRARIEGMKPQGPAPEPVDGEKKKVKQPVDDSERTRLTECEVAPNFVVEAGTEAKGEKMKPFNTEDLDDLEDDDYDDSA